ncbi:MAG TPA: molybdopterin-dependent oxidoreductase [Clostridia bacterium]|nr:molybdopterin-dependent oxidoreductase [Clostridia bacterium]
MHRTPHTMFIVLLAVVLTMNCGCAARTPASPEKDIKGPLQPAKNLGTVEISKYEGKNLSDFKTLEDNSVRGPQTVDITSYRLVIDGAVQTPQRLAYGDILSAARYQKLITLHCVEGWSATGLFEGVLMKDLLARAGPLPSAVTVIFHGHDDYTTSLPLATVLERNLLLAYRVNNADLIARNGYPFQLAAEDKLGYKWCKWVVRIELSTDPDYKGFWERQGYGNDAEVNPSPQFDP